MSAHLITTMSGATFDYGDAANATITIDDIAVALGNTCRFGGHVRNFYSVAEHEILVANLVYEAAGTREECYAALHHDSHEAFTGDVPSPLKAKIKAEAPRLWERLEEECDLALQRNLGVSAELMRRPIVKRADKLALAIEGYALKPAGTALFGLEDQPEIPNIATLAQRYIRCWSPRDAARAFVSAHIHLSGRA